MKVSINWIREINSRYQTSADPMPDGIDALVEKIGSQLGAVDEVIDVGKKYEGIVVAKIASCQKHPNADKLSICLIDDGGVVKGIKRDARGLVQVVCGAPNAKATLAVAWIPPGVVVPSTIAKDPLILETREIRGETSNGMLASPKELDLGDNHEGILEIDEKVKPGQSLAAVYGLDDYIIDIENKMFTHRPDLFGMLGIARELAGIQGHVFKSPEWYKQEPAIAVGRGQKLELKVQNDIEHLVPRFCMLAMSNVSVKPSPMWLQSKLSRVGVRPINNIVDITNLIMLETAQPLHAYDYDKVKALCEGEANIKVRLSKAGEQLVLLGGKKIKLDAGAVVIAAGKQAIGLGGVMGGAGTEVDQNTRNIILEAGTFDMYQTRKTAMTYGLFTDAATRFSKGQSPLQNTAVISRAVNETISLAGARVAGSLVDLNEYDFVRTTVEREPFSVSVEFINSRLGLKLSQKAITKLLANVEINVIHSHRDNRETYLTVELPFWRMDLSIPEDIVEEVGRLYGYDYLPLELPAKSIIPAPEDSSTAFKNRIRQALAKAGANELLRYSFVDGSLMEISGQDIKNAFHIRNALSPDLQYYRLSLIPSLLQKVHPNIKAGYEDFAIYELGRVHIREILDEDKLPAELQRLGLVIASRQKSGGAPYYMAKKYLDYLHNSELSVSDIQYVALKDAGDIPRKWQTAIGSYEPMRSAAVFHGKVFLGIIGEPSRRLKTKLKLPDSTAMLEIDLDSLKRLTPPVQPYSPINRFPALEQDINFKVKTSISYYELTEFLTTTADVLSRKHGVRTVWRPLDIYQRGEDKKHKQITWRVTMSHPERTLTTGESNKLLDELSEKAGQKFSAVRV